MQFPIPIRPFTLAVLVCLPAAAQGPFAQSADNVNGNLIQFTDNGGWCWYQDERVIVDAVGGKMLVAALANKSGVGGGPKDGDVDVSLFDFLTGTSRRVTLKEALTSYGGGDDHNVAALMLRPSGGYLAMYAGHNNDNYSYYRTTGPDGNEWGAEGRFDWNTMPGGTDFATSYSNLFHLSAEGRSYNFARTDDRSPNFMVSSDGGATWAYGGQLTVPDASIGYVNGYFKYTSNGVDRIDFLATEHHPRDYNTSLYHGTVMGGKSYNSTGEVLDADVFDKEAPRPAEFTPVFAAGTTVEGVSMNKCWNIDIQNYPGGALATVFKCRAGASETDHRFLYGRFDQGQWKVTYLAKAGYKLFGSEQDYTGLAAMDPGDPFTLYISTPVHPATGAETGNHEMYRGVSADQGTTWTWTALTSGSTRDNYRPAVPVWDSDTTALVWFRGTMTRSQDYDGAMVGLLLSDESGGMKTYVDATPDNTRLAGGSPLVPSGPTAEMGPADDNWHLRTSHGNGNTLFTSAEVGAEDAPALHTEVPTTGGGPMDVWVYFWANPDNDWRIEAGLDAGNMQVFRSMACRQVGEGEHDGPVKLADMGNTYLYQAYLGRVDASSASTVSVFVDDETTGGDSWLTRTWYDGVAYRGVQPVGIAERKESEFRVGPVVSRAGSAELSLNVPSAAEVIIDVRDLSGRRVMESLRRRLEPGANTVVVPGRALPPGLYLVGVRMGPSVQTRLWAVPGR